MHKIFNRWKHKIFEHDLTTRKKLFQLLGEDTIEGTQDIESKKILQRNRLDKLSEK